ncbi:MAG TPA: NAD(P)/FAD-dependent oxidoreductase [Gemmatimonadales bacterium]
MTDRPHVVIVGGGFAGLEAAKKLGRMPVRVTMVDRANHHTFQPLLYQVATAALNAGEIAKPIRSVLRRYPNLSVLLGNVTRVDVAARSLELADGAVVHYDYLILAPGVRHSYFTRPEWEALAPGLKTIEDALEIRRRVLLAFERAERSESSDERHRLLTFVVVGGGPTGVEVAGAIAEIRRYALARDFRHIDPRDATVLLLEGGPRVMPSYPAELSQKAKESLRRLGVDVRTDSMVTSLEPGAVISAGWTIPTETVVWAAGNAASPLLQTLGVPLDGAGRPIVEADCSIPGHREVFVLGDAAAFRHDPKYPVVLPGVAPVAMQQGRYAARAIAADLRKQERIPFKYVDKGQLAVIGRGQGVADIGPFHIAGLLAWLAWIFIHILYLIGFANRIVVMFRWAVSYLTFERGARLITREWKAG